MPICGSCARAPNASKTLRLLGDMQKEILGVAGVASASPLVIGFSDWRLPSGEMTPVFLVGSDLKRNDLQPWNVVAGSAKALSEPGAVAVDVTYDERLGLDGLGAKANIRGKKVQVAALTEGIRSFTTTPYIFADIASARSYIGLPKSVASYFLVKLKPGADLQRVQHDLQDRHQQGRRADHAAIRRAQPPILAVLNRRRRRAVRRRAARHHRRHRDRGADALFQHQGPSRRVRHLARHGLVQPLHLQRHHVPGAAQRGDRLLPRQRHRLRRRRRHHQRRAAGHHHARR